MDFPPHLTMIIEHNPHKNYYQSVSQYLEELDNLRENLSEEDLRICLEKDELWVIQWYTISPISFYVISSYSLERCLGLCVECLK